MDRDHINTRVIELIAEKLTLLGTNEVPRVEPGNDLSHDLGCDSLDAVELVMSIEDEFAISIPDDDWYKLKTVADVQAYVAHRKSRGK